jgi:hypothetical protein
MDKKSENNRIVNDCFAIIYSARINERTEIVVGKRNTEFGTDYVTWECTDGNNYYWGHYDFQSEQEACLDMYERAAKKLRMLLPKHESECDNSFSKTDSTAVEDCEMEL